MLDTGSLLDPCLRLAGTGAGSLPNTCRDSGKQIFMVDGDYLDW